MISQRTIACVALLAIAGCGGDDAPFDGLRVVGIDDVGSALDPGSGLWWRAPVADVPLQPQSIAMPKLADATLSTLRVQALHDGERIVFRLRWKDPTIDRSYEQDTFSDACAIQFPLDKDAAFTMGHPEGRVQILHWKALWQRDLDDGFQDVQDLHPNFWIDHYWFAERRWPYAVPAAFGDPRSRQWFPGLQAGNPMSAWDRVEPIEDLLAEGFGTLTHQTENASSGRGAWIDGSWAVVIARPLSTADPLDHVFGASQSVVAFAVWDGGAGNVGGRKHHSNWLPYRIEE